MRNPKPSIAELLVDIFGEAVATIIGLIYFGCLFIALAVGYLQFGAIGLIIALVVFALLGIPLVKVLRLLDQ